MDSFRSPAQPGAEPEPAVRTPTGGAPSGKRLLLSLGLWVVVSALAGMATFAALRASSGSVKVDPNLLVPTVVAEVYALLVASLAVGFGANFRVTVALRHFTFGQVGLAAVAVALAYLATGALQGALAPASWSAALGILKGMGSDDGRLQTAGALTCGVILLRAVVLAPLGEELLFRGAVYSWLRRRLSSNVAIPLSAAAFATIHMYPPILPLAFVLGLGFGWVRERSGSTIPTLIIHALHNAGMVAVSYAATGWSARLPGWGS